MKKRYIALIVAGSVIAVAGVAVYWVGRHIFHEPEARGVESVIGEVGGTNVLGVFAHPDDEQTMNGLLWRASEHDGARTSLVTVTRGEAGTQVPVVARQEDLGEVRRAEALKNSFNLGVDEHEVWDYPDGGVPDVDQDELIDRIAGVMRRVQPDVVVGFWPASGATGHKDHMTVGAATEAAIAKIVAEGGAYAGPDHLVYTVSPTTALSLFGGETGAFVIANQPTPDYAMPAEVGKKHEGWRIHASQADYLQKAYGLPAWLVYSLWDREFYHVRDLAADPIR